MAPDQARGAAAGVIAAFVATLALGLVLLFAFAVEIQTVGAGELVERADDARAFLIPDYAFLILYGLVSPLALIGYRNALGAPPRWIAWAAIPLALGAVVDAVENALLWTATDAPAPGTVATAHALALPKMLLFVAGTLLFLAAVAHAVRTLLRRSALDEMR